jgi:hypothetical protein
MINAIATIAITPATTAMATMTPVESPLEDFWDAGVVEIAEGELDILDVVPGRADGSLEMFAVVDEDL